MASLYQRSGSKNWFVRFEYKGKVYRQSTGETERRKARKEMNKIITKVKGDFSVDYLLDQVVGAISRLPEKQQNKKRHEAARRLLQAVDSQVKISNAWQAWLQNPKKRNPGPKTLYSYHGRWNSFQKWVMKNHPEVVAVHELTATMAEEYAGYLWASGVSPSTYNLHINLLKSMCHVLKVQAGLAHNVWSDLPKMELETESRRELKPDELARVCRTAKGTMKYMFAIGLYTGMRLGDVCMLKWNEMDLKKGFIEHIPMKTKRKSKVVRLPIHPVLAAMLRELQKNRRKKDDYIFPHESMLYQQDSGAISKQIQKHFEANKIQTTEKPSNGHRKNVIVRVGFHSLRHSFVSLCAANNVPEVAIMELVGHGSPAMTRLYSHAGSEQKAKAIAALPAMSFQPEKKSNKPRKRKLR